LAYRIIFPGVERSWKAIRSRKLEHECSAFSGPNLRLANPRKIVSLEVYSVSHRRWSGFLHLYGERSEWKKAVVLAVMEALEQSGKAVMLAGTAVT